VVWLLANYAKDLHVDRGADQMKNVQRRRSRLNFIILSIFITLTFGIILAGYFYYHKHRNRLEFEIKKQLLSISKYKSDQISNWIGDRLRSAEIISRANPINSSLQQYVINSNELISQKNATSMLDAYRKCYSFESISFVDPNFKQILNIPLNKMTTDSFDKKNGSTAIASKKVLFSDIHKNEMNGNTEIDIHVPMLKISGRDTTLVGSLICSIDPLEFLCPLILSWPTLSNTGESFIVRHEGNNLVYLSELRFHKNATLNFIQPDTDKNLPAAMAADGKEGIVEGRDYRGVEVLAAIRHIPNTPWFLVSKEDKDEIYAPLKRSTYIATIVTFLLLISSGSITGFFLRKNNLLFYKELYQAELEKNILKQHFNYLIKYANDIILLLNQDGIIVEANDKAISTYGYTKKELLGKNIKDLLDTASRDSVFEQMTEVYRSGGLLLENIHKKKDGTLFPVEISARVIEIENVKYYQGIIRDITERKKDEEMLTAALVKAQASDKLKSEFLSQMSHEVRTPLNAVLGFSSFIKSEFEDKLGKEYLDVFSGIEHGCKRITKTMDSILNISQLYAGTFDLQIIRVDLGGYIIPKLITEYSLAANAKNLEFRFRNLVKDSTVSSDQYCVEQIFSNLIDNSIKFTDKGFVEVRILKDASNVIVEIEDSGIGISNEFIPKLFEPFVQEDRGYSRKYEGNGLGLALAKKYCEVNNAVIEVESEKNVGSTFRVKFNERIV